MNNDKFTRRRRWLIGSFILYMGTLFYLVFFSYAYGRNNAQILRYQNMNLIPFATIQKYTHAWGAVSNMVIITNILGNIVAFIPFGLLLPVLKPSLKGLWRIFFASLGLSAFIELVQGLLGVGVMDVDDLILNVLGGLVGYLVFRLFSNYLMSKASKA